MCPRLMPRVIKEAAGVHPWLTLLLPECKTVSHARQELRWLVQEFGTDGVSLHEACRLRSKHVPLQYILGSQPFGELDILCRKNVLIPRWETEEWSLQLARAIANGSVPISNRKWHIVDICTGTGCIPLTLLNETKHLFKDTGLQVDAIDCSSNAIKLTTQNYSRNFYKDPLINGNPTKFKFNVRSMDILNESQVRGSVGTLKQPINILTCNPPYIPKDEFIKNVRSSVRAYEPRLALLGNMEFYENLVNIWIKHSLIHSFVYEIGNIEQAIFVQKNLPEKWITGIKYDSNDKPRCVYGYNLRSGPEYSDIFKSFSNHNIHVS